MMNAGGKARGLRADYCFTRVVEITPEWLTSKGIQGLLLDIDNTITRWEERGVPADELGWLRTLVAAGFGVRLLSNGLQHKVTWVAGQTGVPHVTGRPMKPFPDAFARGLRELGLPANRVLMIGDGVITDIMPANRLGIWTCLVEPLSNRDFPGSKVWRFIEMTFHLRRSETAEGDYRCTKLTC